MHMHVSKRADVDQYHDLAQMIPDLHTVRLIALFFVHDKFPYFSYSLQ